MFFRKITFTSLLTVGICLPLLAQADLTLNNNTKQDSTSRINGGLCTSSIPVLVKLGIGIAKAGTSITIKTPELKVACFANETNCRADVYMTADCSGPIISTAILDASSGLKSISPPINGYKLVGWDANQVTFAGPDAIAKK